MRFEADIVIEGPFHERAAVVEVDNRMDLSPRDSDHRRTYMRLTVGRVDLPYYMLVSQDTAFVWKYPNEQPMRLDMKAVMRRYLPGLTPEKRLYGFQVETLVSQWLSELATGWRAATEEPEATLASIGFLDAVRNGTVHSKAVV